MGILEQIPDSILAQLPSYSPPPGVKPNFQSQVTRGTTFIIVGGIMLPIMMLFLGIRITSKIKIMGRYTWDDLTCLLTAFGAIAYYILVVINVKKGGFGHHGWDLSVLAVLNPWFSVPLYIHNWTSTIILALAKVTFFIFYLQLFRPLKTLRMAIWAGLVFTIVIFTGYTIAQLVSLSPRPGQSWAEVYEEPRIRNILKISVPVSATSFGVDVYILLLPVFGVAKLKLSTRRKFGVLIIFLTGLGACIASSLSVYYKVVLNRNEGDSSWHSVPVLITVHVEMCTGVICSCMPSLAKFIGHYFPNFNLIETVLSLKIFSSLRSQAPDSKGPSPSFRPWPSRYKSRQQRMQGESNQTLNDLSGNFFKLPDVELGNVNGVQTMVDAGHVMHNGNSQGIHLHREWKQTSHEEDRDQLSPRVMT